MSEYEGENRRKKGHPFELNGGRGWILTFGFWLLSTTFAGAWWASAVSTEMVYMSKSIEQINAKLERNIDDRYRGRDAARDFLIRDRRINKNEQEIERVRDGLFNTRTFKLDG